MSNNLEAGSLSPDVRVGVVLLHGLTGMPSEMKPVVKHLTKIGCAVECPVLAGHGGSQDDLLAVGWQDWLTGARRAVNEFARNYDFVVVGGLSMGALLAALCAIDNPKVAAVVLLSTTLKYDGRNSNIWQHLLWLVDIFPCLGRWCYWTEQPPYGLKDERLQRIITKQVEAAKRGETTDFGLFRTYAKSLRQLHLLVRETRRLAPQVRCPALIIHSLEDSLTTKRNAVEICSLLGSQDKTLMFVGGCDHVLTLDLRKKDIVRTIGNFIAEQSWNFARSRQSTQTQLSVR